MVRPSHSLLLAALFTLSGCQTGWDDRPQPVDDDDSTFNQDDDDTTAADDDDDDSAGTGPGSCDCQSSVAGLGAPPAWLLLGLLALGVRRRR